METVKMTSQVQVRTKAGGRNMSADSTVEKDAFLKLLQEKKELAQPGEKTEKAEDGQKPETTEGQKDSFKEPQGTETAEDEPIEVSPQEVLLQAGLQQAAAQIQMSESPPELSQEAVSETEILQAVEAEGKVLSPQEDTEPETKTLTPDQEMEEGEVVKALTGAGEEAVKPVVSQKEGQDGNNSSKEGEGREIPMEASDRKPAADQAGQKVPPEPKVQTAPSSAAVEEKEKSQPGQETGQVSLYGGQNHTQRSEQLVGHERTESIPLRTSHSQLPQDLGKTLASRLPGNGRELIIELEPASLGKLTIKMVYEGSRAAVSILASNPRTLELLSQKASEIASILEEKTGQETVIYTQAPEREEGQPDEDSGGGQGRKQEGQERRDREDDRHETESFAQQLRLGLV
ncbi:MAG: hypothetical protein HFG75_13365 [Hungatella sp.]|nr:hypothetical protein [Hungatella sp.]